MAYEKDNRWGVFLRELSRVPSKTEALKKAKIDQAEYLIRCEDDADFVSAVATAYDAGVDALEDVAVQRAMLGVDEPVYWQGIVVGFKTVYSDRLLTFLLQGNREKYRGEGEKAANLSEEARNTISEVFESIQSEYQGKKIDDSKIFAPKSKNGPKSLFRAALESLGKAETSEGKTLPLLPQSKVHKFAPPTEAADNSTVITVDDGVSDELAVELGTKPRQSAKLKSRRR